MNYVKDLVALLLVLLIGFLVGVKFLMAKTVRHEQIKRSGVYRIVDNPKIEALPQVVSSGKVRGLGARSAKPQGREPNKGQLFRIGIIDTGFDKALDTQGMKLCSSGHFDFNSNTPRVATSHYHGTAVAQAIVEEMEGVNYCLVIFQVGSYFGITPEAVGAALKLAATEGLIAVNISLEGPTYSFEERQQLYGLASKGTAVFVAAGNRHLNLDEACMSYPSCYGLPNVYVVGATQDDGQFKASYSNYGSRISVWKDGTVNFNDENLRGTSFASPHALGDYVHSLSRLAAGG
jgi:subtilisin family serine protease